MAYVRKNEEIKIEFPKNLESFEPFSNLFIFKILKEATHEKNFLSFFGAKTVRFFDREFNLLKEKKEDRRAGEKTIFGFFGIGKFS